MRPKRRLEFRRYDYAAFAAFTVYAVCSLIIPMVLVQMGSDLGFPLDRGGLASGGMLHLSRSAVMVVALLSCGVIGGRFGNRFAMGGALLAMGAGIIGCGIASAYWMLFPLLAIAGVGEGVCEGLATPFVQKLHPDAPERYVNLAHSFWSVGIAVCVLLSGTLISLGVSWRAVMVGAGALAALASLGFLWREDATHPYPKSTRTGGSGEVWQKSREIFRNGKFWLYCFGMFVGAGAEFCLTFWAASFLQLNFQTGVLIAGVGTAVIALGMFVGRAFFGWIATERNLKWILLWASLGTIPVTMTLGFVRPEHFHSTTWMVSVLLVLLFLCGIGIAPYWPTLQVYGVKNLPHLDDTLLYIYFSAVGIPGCGFFTYLVGALGNRYGLDGAFRLIPFTLLIYAVVIFVDGWCLKSTRQK